MFTQAPASAGFCVYKAPCTHAVLTSGTPDEGIYLRDGARPPGALFYFHLHMQK